MPSRTTVNWIAFASGPFGYWAISATADGRLRVEASIDTGTRDTNKALFDEFATGAAAWEELVGFPLSLECLDERRASRIATYHDVDLDNNASRSAVRSWASDALNRMYTALNEPLCSRAKELRLAASVAGDIKDSIARDEGFEPPLDVNPDDTYLVVDQEHGPFV